MSEKPESEEFDEEEDDEAAVDSDDLDVDHLIEDLDKRKKTAVKVGEPMPDFTLPYLEPAPDGGRPQSKTARLSDFKGKQVVVLAFYPAAFSPG